jgi:hypothetical protein
LNGPRLDEAGVDAFPSRSNLLGPAGNSTTSVPSASIDQDFGSSSEP